jgi:protein SCO1/2
MQGMDFLHTSALIFLSEEGKITRYLHGTYFLPMDLKMAVVETAEGKSGPSMSRVLSYCYSYDPAGQSYVFNVTKVAGTIILFFAVVTFLVLALKPRKKVETES